MHLTLDIGHAYAITALLQQDGKYRRANMIDTGTNNRNSSNKVKAWRAYLHMCAVVPTYLYSHTGAHRYAHRSLKECDDDPSVE